MVLRIGHRGAAGYAPENTLSSIQKAIDLGVDLVEVDVQSTADGRLVLMHDKRIDRTTDGSGYVSNLMLSDIRGVSVGGKERVPTLEEVLMTVRSRVDLMLEVITPGISKKVCEEVQKCEFDGAVIIASFLHAELLEVQKLLPSAHTLALIEGVPVNMKSFAFDAKASHVGISIDSITETFLSTLHAAHFKVFVYTVNDPIDIEWAKKLGVDGIISDYPDRIHTNPGS